MNETRGRTKLDGRRRNGTVFIYAMVFSIVLVVAAASYIIFYRATVPTDFSVEMEIAYEIQKIKDKGEPTTIDELVPEEIPDNENAALLYKQAFKLKEDLENRYKEQWQYIPYEGSKAWEEVPEEEKEKMRNLLLYNSAFPKFWQLLEQASNMKCQFLKRKDYAKGVSLQLPHLRYSRSCCRLLSAKAKLEAEEGEIDKALNTCLVSLKFAKSLSNEPLLISQLVRNALDAITLTQIEEVLKKGEANIEIYVALIEEIRKERGDKITYLGLLGERTVFGMQVFPLVKEAQFKEGEREEIEQIFGDMMPKKEKEQIIAMSGKDPERFLDENELTYLKTMAKMILLAKSPYWEVREELQRFSDEVQKLPVEKAIMTQVLLPALSKAYNREAKIDAQLGNAEIALSCHIYKQKYGDYPSSLKELTSEIIPSLPLDPFTGKDYIYDKKDEGFTVYSVGEDLKDDGGTSKLSDLILLQQSQKNLHYTMVKLFAAFLF